MRKRNIGALVGVVVLLSRSTVHATNAHCTIAQATTIVYTLSDCEHNNPDLFDQPCALTFPVAPADGRSFDVTFDTTGTFSLDTTGWGGEIDFDTEGGFIGLVVLPAAKTTGTIDAGGNVFLPGFSMNFDCHPPGAPDTLCSGAGSPDTVFDFSTAMGHTLFSGSEWLSEGKALDFSTGKMTLTGIAPSTLIAPQVSGLRVICQLDTVPQASTLPKAAVLTSAKGKVTGGGDVTATSPHGDHLTLAAKLVAGGLGVVPPATNDLFLKISAPDGSTAAVVLVKGADLTQKKKAFVVSNDTDGSKLQILFGLKQTGDLAAVPGGKLTVKPGKKFTTVSLSLDGLDLSKLLATDATTGTLRLQIGHDTAAKSIALKATKTGRKFH